MVVGSQAPKGEEIDMGSIHCELGFKCIISVLLRVFHKGSPKRTVSCLPLYPHLSRGIWGWGWKTVSQVKSIFKAHILSSRLYLLHSS